MKEENIKIIKEQVLKDTSTKELCEELEKREGVDKLRQLKPGDEVIIDDESYSGPLMLLMIID